jgi:hypothetical protein
VATDFIPTEPVVDRSRRELVKSAVGLVLTTSLGVLGADDALAASANEPGEAVLPWGDPSTLVAAIGAGTLAVPSVAESAEAYRKGFGYIEHWHGRIPKEMASFWGVPAMAGRNAAVIGPPDFQRGMIRIVELGRDFQQVSYRDTLGWVALEIQVRSPKDLVTQLKGLPFIHEGTGGPGEAKDPDGKPLYRAINFTGPSGEPLNLTQHVQLDELKISTGRNNVGPLFIQTLHAYPYQAVRDLYFKTLRMKMRMEVNTRRASSVALPGLPKDSSYKMSAVRTTEYCSIEIDEVSESTPQRPAGSGLFAPGVSMCTLIAHNLDAVKAAFKQANVKFAEVKANSCPPFKASRAIFCLGHAGERLEVVEVGKA